MTTSVLGAESNVDINMMGADLFDFEAIDWSLYYPLPIDDGDFLFDNAETADLRDVFRPDANGTNRDLSDVA
jgi:hypothetical protein